jgi:excisionase family DNA binding protein
MLNTAAAAKFLGVSTSRIHALVRDKRLAPEHHDGRVILFQEAELKRFKAIPRSTGRPAQKG